MVRKGSGNKSKLLLLPKRITRSSLKEGTKANGEETTLNLERRNRSNGDGLKDTSSEKGKSPSKKDLSELVSDDKARDIDRASGSTATEQMAVGSVTPEIGGAVKEGGSGGNIQEKGRVNITDKEKANEKEESKARLGDSKKTSSDQKNEGTNEMSTKEEFPVLHAIKRNWAPKDRKTLAIREYVSLFKENRNILKAERLTYHEDVMKGKLKIMEADVVEKRVEWAATLIGVIAGNHLPYCVVKDFVAAEWRVTMPKMYLKDNGVFVFKFRCESDMDWVLSNGPWNLLGSRPLLLKCWSPGSPISWSAFDRVPIWVCVPDLDPTLFSNTMLSRLGSSIGRPLCIDERTAKGERISYARILVEVTEDEAAVEYVEIEDIDGSTYKQKIVFEWLPWICKECCKFGHTLERCPYSRTRDVAAANLQWVPKNGTKNVNAVNKINELEGEVMIARKEVYSSETSSAGETTTAKGGKGKSMTDREDNVTGITEESMTVRSMAEKFYTEKGTVKNVEDKKKYKNISDGEIMIQESRVAANCMNGAAAGGEEGRRNDSRERENTRSLGKESMTATIDKRRFNAAKMTDAVNEEGSMTAKESMTGRESMTGKIKLAEVSMTVRESMTAKINPAEASMTAEEKRTSKGSMTVAEDKTTVTTNKEEIGAARMRADNVLKAKCLLLAASMTEEEGNMYVAGCDEIDQRRLEEVQCKSEKLRKTAKKEEAGQNDGVTADGSNISWTSVEMKN